MAQKYTSECWKTLVKGLTLAKGMSILLDMKTRQLSFFAWLLGATLFAATLASCATQTQNCSAYQQVQTGAQPMR
jgi:hypothetical protein